MLREILRGAGPFFGLGILLSSCGQSSGGGSTTSSTTGTGVGGGGGTGGTTTSTMVTTSSGGAGGASSSSSGATSSSTSSSSSSSSTTTSSSSSSSGGAVAYDSCGLCGGGQLLIDGVCTLIEGEPKYGCNEGSMKPCPTAPGRLPPHCNGSVCADGPCDANHLDCNGDASDGCEANINSPKTCGSCTNACPAGQLCRKGTCVTACAPTDQQTPYGACLDTVPQCSVPCPFPPQHGTSSCSGTTCTITCDPGFSACTGGCFDLQRDTQHCGGCNPCPSPPAGGAMACENGTCTPKCPAGLELCGDTCADVATDLDNCGTCGAKCATGLCVGGVCDASLPRVLASNVGTNAWVAVDATTVFYADANAGTISRVEKTGGAAQVLVSGDTSVAGLAVDAGYVYWSSSSGNAIKRVPKAGGAAEVVATATKPTVVRVDATDVFWSNTANHTLLKAPSQGGGAASVLANIPVGGGVNDLVLDDAYAYWGVSPNAAGGVFRAPKDGAGPVDQLAGNIVVAGTRLAVDEGYLYMADNGYGPGIERAWKDFSAVRGVIKISMGSVSVDAIAVGKHYVYAHSRPPTPLVGVGTYSAKALKCGGQLTAPPLCPACFSSDPYGAALVLDDAFVYGVANGNLQRTPQ